MSRIENADVEAAIVADHIDYTVLVELQFVSGTQRFHIGRGQITVDGQVWVGTGEFTSISAIIERPDGRDYSQLVVGLSGVDPSLLAYVPNRTDYAGQPASLYFVPFNVTTGLAIVPIEPAWFEGFMDFMTYERKASSASISVTIKHQDCLYAETIGLLLADEHQQSLFPGDLLCNLIPDTRATEIVWGGSKVDSGVTDIGFGGSLYPRTLRRK